MGDGGGGWGRMGDSKEFFATPGKKDPERHSESVVCVIFFTNVKCNKGIREVVPASATRPFLPPRVARLAHEVDTI